jgi:endonuclease-3
LGWVKTRDPHSTEEALEKIIPKNYWIELNTLLVTFGQNICVPVSPFCSKCSVNKYCRKTGVTRSR